MAGTPTYFSYVHSTPGRMRIRVTGRRGDDGFLARLEHEIGVQPGVTQARANPLTGSVLIQFDPRRLDDREILARLEQIGLVGDMIASVAAVPLPSKVVAQIGAAVGKELVKAALAQAVGKSPVGVLLAFL